MTSYDVVVNSYSLRFCNNGECNDAMKMSQKRFGGVNRRFQAKPAKSKNVHIIKTAASILTKFCTVIKTTKCPSWVVPTLASQIEDGGRPPSLKNWNWSRFERFRRNLTRWRSSTLLTMTTVKILKFRKSKMAECRGSSLYCINLYCVRLLRYIALRCVILRYAALRLALRCVTVRNAVRLHMEVVSQWVNTQYQHWRLFSRHKMVLIIISE